MSLSFHPNRPDVWLPGDQVPDTCAAEPHLVAKPNGLPANTLIGGVPSVIQEHALIHIKVLRRAEVLWKARTKQVEERSGLTLANCCLAMAPHIASFRTPESRSMQPTTGHLTIAGHKQTGNEAGHLCCVQIQVVSTLLVAYRRVSLTSRS